jgi:WD40 repeat protein
MKLLFKIINLIIGLNLLVSVCSGETTFDYNLNKPDVHHDLPDILNEVSGITNVDFSHVALVQDELGTVFIYNFIKGKIISQHSFNDTGDFEGIAYTGDTKERWAVNRMD